jgi:hypothetical protein
MACQPVGVASPTFLMKDKPSLSFGGSSAELSVIRACRLFRSKALLSFLKLVEVLPPALFRSP